MDSETRKEDQETGARGPTLRRDSIESRYVDGPVARVLAIYAAPLMVTYFLNTIAGTWAAIWVSHVMGPDALTAVVNANLFINLIAGVVMGVGGAAGIAVSQAYGGADWRNVKRVAGTALSAALVVSLVVAVAGIVFAQDLLEAIHMPAAARAPADTYFTVTCLGLPGMFVTMLLMMMMRAVGDARTPFIFNVVGTALGMALGPALLVGAGGLPKFGIAGLAFGGVAANLITLAALLVTVYRRRHPLALRGDDLRLLRPDPALTAMLARQGAPMALESVIVQGAYFVLLAMVNSYGGAVAAAYAGAAQIWIYVQMPSMAIAASMSAMAAMAIGAGRWARVDQIAVKGVMLSVGITLTTTLFVYALGDWPLRAFLPTGSEALREAHALNLIVLWGWVLLAITSGLSGIVRANAAMLAPALIYAVTMWAMRVPFAMALQPVLQEAAIWWSFPVGTIGSALLAIAYYRWGRWRQNRPMLSHGGRA